jgi:DNA invertase Pin-like site-specific DNA recombinase
VAEIKAIKYRRKSIKPKSTNDIDSIRYQDQVIDEYCEKHHMLIIKSYSDIGYSGKDTNRPELQEMLTDLKRGSIEADVLLMYSIDRLGRDLANNIETVLEIISYVKQVVFVADNISNDNEWFKIMFLIKTAAAQEERERLLKRFSDGRRAKALHYKTFNATYTPLGYVKEQSSNKLVPANWTNTDKLSDVEGLAALQFIFLGYLFNMSFREIERCLNKHFIHTRRGKTWSQKAVQYVLGNPIYIGVLKGILEQHQQYSLKDANVEPLIDQMMFELIQFKLSLEKRGRKRKKKIQLPYLCICTDCMVPINQAKNDLFCTLCGQNIASQRLFEKIQPDILFEIINAGDFNLPEHIQSKRNVLTLKISKLEKKKAELLNRQKTLEILFDDEKDLQKELFQFNSNELIKVEEELSYSQALKKFLFNEESNRFLDTAKNIISNQAIATPFIVGINFTEKKLFILFHQELFKEMIEIGG